MPVEIPQPEHMVSLGGAYLADVCRQKSFELFYCSVVGSVIVYVEDGACSLCAGELSDYYVS